jgi:hypothetical protein
MSDDFFKASLNADLVTNCAKLFKVCLAERAFSKVVVLGFLCFSPKKQPRLTFFTFIVP